MSRKNTRRDQDNTERGESWGSEAQSDETRHGNRGEMDRDEPGQPMPPKFREPRQPQKKK